MAVRILTEDQFLDVCREIAGTESLTASTSLNRNGFDSLALYELLVKLDGDEVEIPTELVETLDNIGDLYHFYVTIASAVTPGAAE